MKRSDSILLNYYRGNLPKYQQRPGTVNNDAILAYMRGLPGGAPRPQLSQQQIAQLVSKTKPLTQLSATQIKQQQYNLKQKEQDAAEERSRQFTEEEERRLQAERAAARRTREAVIGGDENAMFTFPTGETKRWRDMNWREQQYVAGKNLGALNRGDWTDYINPLAMIGSLSEGLATAPYVAQQTDSYLPYVTGIGAPLLTGALAGVGAKNVGQFAENIISPIPGNLSNISNALRNRYINIATGNNPLNYAWRSPAKGITDEQADLMLEQLRNDIPLDAISKDLLADYQHTSGPFTGRFESGNINLFKRAGLEDAIAQRNVISSTGKPTVIVRRFDPENSELYGLNEAGVFESNRPTSWSVGKGAEYTTKKDRLVVQLPSNTRALLNEYNFSKFGQDVGKLKEERELIMGSGSRFKPLNRVRNELGGYDYIHRFEGYNPTVWDDIRGLNAENLAQRVDLSKDIGQGGHFNAGVYPFKRDPNILIKLGRISQNESFGINAPNIKTGIPEDLSEFPTEAWGRMAIPFREIDLSTITPQTLKRAIRPDSQILGTMMQRVKGKPLSEYSVEDLANIEPYVYQGLASDVKHLAKKNVGVDFYGDNFHLNVYPSGYKSFNLFDLGRLPNTNTGVFPISALHGLNAKAFSQGVNEIDPKMIKSILGDKIKNAIYESSRNAGEGAYSDQEVYEAIQKALQNISAAKFKKGGPIVNPRGYIDGQPPKGSNWRIPGDGMGTSITMDLPNMPDEILVVPDGDFDQAKVMKRGEEEYFAGADFVDEYTMGPGGTTGPKIAVRDYPTMKGGGLTANKAREILHHGEVHGRPLTEKQRRYFGAMSKGHTKNYQLGGNALAMLRDYGGGISVPRLNSPLPKAQLGIPVKSTTPIISPILNLIDLFAGDKEDVAAKPKAPEVTLEEYFNIVDPRKIRATTGKPINPNVDLVAGQYPSSYIAQELKLAKQKGLSKEDAWNLAAIAFQESGWGKTDRNLGHVIGPAGKGNYGSTLINAYMNKMAEADRLGVTDPYTRLQVYNGLGKIFPSTEQKYHGFKMKKIYGVPVPQEGLSLRDNPLYGKQVVDIRENVLKKNPEVVQYVESLYKKDGGGFGVFGYVGDGWYKNGGQHGGLDRWFAEKWVDIKSGKPCGRQEGESRAYPACRPSKRVSSKTPKTSGEMSSSEKAKFKSSKTSSQRISYNHKRR
jgi:hypothetical protein